MILLSKHIYATSTLKVKMADKTQRDECRSISNRRNKFARTEAVEISFPCCIKSFRVVHAPIDSILQGTLLWEQKDAYCLLVDPETASSDRPHSSGTDW